VYWTRDRDRVQGSLSAAEIKPADPYNLATQTWGFQGSITPAALTLHSQSGGTWNGAFDGNSLVLHWSVDGTAKTTVLMLATSAGYDSAIQALDQQVAATRQQLADTQALARAQALAQAAQNKVGAKTAAAQARAAAQAAAAQARAQAQAAAQARAQAGQASRANALANRQAHPNG